MNENTIIERLVNNIIDYTVQTRERVYNNVRQEMVNYYWNVGKMIVEEEQGGDITPEYGRKLYIELSKRLTKKMGKGYSRSNLFNMRNFYITYPIVQTSGQLSWSHYCELIGIKDENERKFYEIEATNEAWGIRTLQRQYNSSLYERLALSREKDEVLRLASEGNVITKPQDIVKQPTVLEFLGLDEKAKYVESDLETAIINKLQKFLLELGKGYLFEARQKRFTFNEDNYYVDLVFYNRILRCYVLIDLKIDKLTHQDLGQMMMYVHYYNRYEKLPEENPTVGILLCREKDDALVEITLPEDANIYASEYQLYLPDKKELQKKLNEWIEEGPDL